MADNTARYAEELFPSDYESWRYCIEVKCGLNLTPEFIQKRITVFSDANHEESQRFADVYGDPWREQVLNWYQRAATEA